MERIKEVERLLREQKKPEPEKDKMEACKIRMEGELRQNVILPSRPFLARLWETAGYFSGWTWGIFVFFCAATVFLMLKVPYENALVVCSLFTPALGVFFVPELARSFSEGMWELEQSCYYSLGEILALKMIILGMASGILIAFGAAVTRVESGSFLDFELWICLPFLAVSSLSFFLLRKIRSRQAEYGLIGADLMAVGVIIWMWSVKDELYSLMEQRQTGLILLAVLGILSGTLIFNGVQFFRLAGNGELVWEEEIG